MDVDVHVDQAHNDVQALVVEKLGEHLIRVVAQVYAVFRATQEPVRDRVLFELLRVEHARKHRQLLGVLRLVLVPEIGEKLLCFNSVLLLDQIKEEVHKDGVHELRELVPVVVDQLHQPVPQVAVTLLHAHGAVTQPYCAHKK